MEITADAQTLIALGLDEKTASSVARKIQACRSSPDAAKCWSEIRTETLTPEHPFALHRFLYDLLFSTRDNQLAPPAAWVPDKRCLEETNLFACMRDLGIDSYQALHQWSLENRSLFWEYTVRKLGIRFQTPYTAVADFSSGVSRPRWLPGARLNITESCFQAPEDRAAIIYQREQGPLQRWSYRDLASLANRVANGIAGLGFSAGDRIAIDMPMTAESVAVYLGILKAGCVAVSIADSFATPEIATRLRLSQAGAVFTQDWILRAGKRLPLYEKVAAARPSKIIVLPAEDSVSLSLETGDLSWNDFLSPTKTFQTVACDPDHHTNILFSSGTTGEPKAIPWTQVTPIKCAADAFYHHDVHEGEVLAWPTNLGWMMGPWLIYAALINRASLALYYGPPTGRAFGRFVEDAGVTLLGVVPSLVKTWKSSGCMDGLDWSKIRAFSSTGECSNEDDYLWLMSRVRGYRPVVEYCGGTEIGGGYVTSTLVQPNSPSTFSTPALGLDLLILDDKGVPCPVGKAGEAYLLPPSIGLSNELVGGQDHHRIYYDGTPCGPEGQSLRRHGDEMVKMPGGYFRVLGRADDTMNLAGIKVSAAEIERALSMVRGIKESAAVAIAAPGGGASLLVIYAVPEGKSPEVDPELLREEMQKVICSRLNPLFKIHQVVVLQDLPRTASNKVMRRVLREQNRSLKEKQR